MTAKHMITRVVISTYESRAPALVFVRNPFSSLLLHDLLLSACEPCPRLQSTLRGDVELCHVIYSGCDPSRRQLTAGNPTCARCAFESVAGIAGPA